MGYHLYITRRSHLDDESGPEISKEEWLDIVEHDPDLEIFEEGGYPSGEVVRMGFRGSCHRRAQRDLLQRRTSRPPDELRCWRLVMGAG